MRFNNNGYYWSVRFINVRLLIAAVAYYFFLEKKVTKIQVIKKLPRSLPWQLTAGGGCQGHSRQRWPAFITAPRSFDLQLACISFF